MSILSFQILFIIFLSQTLYFDTIKLGFCHNGLNVTCYENERKALLELKSNLSDVSGRLSSWIGNDCCRWKGVTCSNRTKHVIELDLQSPFITSNPFPPTSIISLSSLDLKYLNYLDLRGNNFERYQFSSFFKPLENLRYLDLSYTFMSGSIPHDLGNLSNLQYLYLSGNDFNSTLPLWLFNLRSLMYLDLSYNSLRGFSELSALDMPNLSYNYSIEGKQLRLGKLCNLIGLKLNGNKFSGDLANFINILLPCPNNKLEFLDLSYNELSGNIPQNLGQLSSLVYLDLSKNFWEGLITEASLHNLSSLKELSIGTKSSNNTSLTLNISSDWVPPFKLRSILIEFCQLGPKFPEWLKNQTSLIELTFSHSKISDTIPDWFLKLNLRLGVLDLSFNQLRGQVPNSLQFIDRGIVDLGSNLFEESVSQWSSNVSQLFLRDNLLSGPIPSDIGVKMHNLVYLDISGNSLNGSIPMSLGNLTRLRILSVSNNQLSGNIPQIWDKTIDLWGVDMSNNYLTGTIPSSMGSLSSLTRLMLSRNNLQGELTSSLRNCSHMYILDLGDNQLSGNIPTWIGENMQFLGILRLRNNFLKGNIPLKLCSLFNLHILDLSKNSLSGPIPYCIGNLARMRRGFDSLYSAPPGAPHTSSQGNILVNAKGSMLSYGSTLDLVKSLDLSNNRLSGEIPTSITSLLELQTLNLSMNQLKGNIPSEIGSMKMLETLDLSINHLTGNIPTSMVLLNFLQYLNLSYNNLSGHIPSSNHFQTLNDPSIYAGNDALCGSPLQNKCEKEISFTSENGDTTDENDDLQQLIIFVVAGAGFFLGFWGVCGTLAINKHLRYAYFNFLQRIYARIMNCCTG